MSAPPLSRPAAGEPTVTAATRVLLRPLSMRQDGESWVIGRAETGDFIVVPAVAHRVIALLSEGHAVGEAARVIQAETGKAVAVADFVVSLDSLAFIAAIDGAVRTGPEPLRPSLPWLRPQHVRWLLHPALPWLALAVIAAGLGMLAVNPALTPRYHDLVWSRHSGIVLAVDAAFGWVILGLHELAHLATARGAGVPARLSLATRLQFLAAQTDVSGVWAARRRHRMTVYLSGIAVNLIVASICLLAEGTVAHGGLPRQLLALTAMQSLLFLPIQLLVFMRTDLYFVIQDMAGCANLYADGSAHVRYLARRITHAIGRNRDMPSDPANALPTRERRAVHAYSWLLLSGTIASITVAVFVSAPVAFTLLAHALGELAGVSPLGKLDGIAVLIAICGFWTVWVCTWWRRHSGQLTTLCKRRASSQRQEGGDNAIHRIEGQQRGGRG